MFGPHSRLSTAYTTVNLPIINSVAMSLYTTLHIVTSEEQHTIINKAIHIATIATRLLL